MKRADAKALSRYTILGAAAVLFESIGYEAATIRMIAAEAGYSTGAVFAHWPGKREIYAEVYGQPPSAPGQVRWVPIDQLKLPTRCGGDTNRVILGNAAWDGTVSREWHDQAYAKLVLDAWEGGPTHFLVGIPPVPAAESDDA